MFFLPQRINNTSIHPTFTSFPSLIMADYTSSWWRFRYARLQDLINTRQDSLTSIEHEDEELLESEDNRILHERNTSEVIYIYISSPPTKVSLVY